MEGQLEGIINLAFSFTPIPFSSSVASILIRFLFIYCNSLVWLKLKWQCQRLVMLGEWVVINTVAYMYVCWLVHILRCHISFMSFTCERVINYFLFSISVWGVTFSLLNLAKIERMKITDSLHF